MTQFLNNTTQCTLSSLLRVTRILRQRQPTENILQHRITVYITLTLSRSSSKTRIDSNFLWAIMSFLSSIPIFSAISSSSVNPIFRNLLCFLFSSLKLIIFTLSRFYYFEKLDGLCVIRMRTNKDTIKVQGLLGKVLSGK